MVQHHRVVYLEARLATHSGRESATHFVTVSLAMNDAVKGFWCSVLDICFIEAD